MKRTPIRRYTPLPRPTKPMKRSPMKRMSAQKRKEKRETDGPRKAFRVEAGECMKCGRHPAAHTHEIARGGVRFKAVHRRRLWLALCEDCHDGVGDLHEWPVESQLALRLAWEVRRSVFELNEVRGRAQTAVTVDMIYPLMAAELRP